MKPEKGEKRWKSHIAIGTQLVKSVAFDHFREDIVKVDN
jgi:hypothetical protein